VIDSICTYLPKRIVSNNDLSLLFSDWPADQIFSKTGIRERRVAEPEQCASDLACEAARALLLESGNCIDWLLFCTQSPDYQLPTTACILQQRLGLPTSCAAVDFNLGCSGYVYGLALAQSLISGGGADRVLLLTADTYSKLLHPEDKTTRTIFGDAGTATLLSRKARARLHSFILGTDGLGEERLIVRGGGARHGCIPKQKTLPPLAIDDCCLYMDGPEIFNFTISAVPTMVNQVLEKADLSMNSIDLFVFHQANAFMLEHLRRKLAIPKDRFVIDLEFSGNTVSSSIPLALANATAAGRLKVGMKILLAGFGVGYSWGGCILEW
jgi:3-oxoacyl-[acyl-carrier-protein] synthase-3